MPTYGYRLFRFRIAAGQTGRTAINFKDCSGEHYLDVATRLFKALSLEAMIGEPPTQPGERATTAGAQTLFSNVNLVGQEAFRVENIDVVENTLRVSVWSGKVGSHGKALSIGGAAQDADISDKAPGRLFRLVLALPNHGKVGILGVEDISRSTPVTAVAKWLHWRSRVEAEEQAAQGGARVTSWRPMVEPLADEQRLIDMIKAGRVEGLELVKHFVSGARTRHEKKDRVLAPVASDSMAKAVAEVVQGWMRVSATEDELTGKIAEPVTGQQAAQQLAALIGPEIVQLDADEGFVVLQDDDDRRRKINPSRMSEIFTYAQPGGVKVDAPRFYSLIRSTAERLQRAANIPVDWPAQ